MSGKVIIVVSDFLELKDTLLDLRGKQIPSPEIPDFKEAHCWVEVKDDEVYVEYTARYFSGEWANAIASAIIENLVAEKAGWDANDSLLHPFKFLQEANPFQKSIDDNLIEYQVYYIEAAREIINPNWGKE